MAPAFIGDGVLNIPRDGRSQCYRAALTTSWALYVTIENGRSRKDDAGIIGDAMLHVIPQAAARLCEPDGR